MWTVYALPYSWKYWWELNLAVEPKIAIARMLVDLNLAVWYGIAMCIIYYVSRNFGGFLIWRLLIWTTKLPKFLVVQYIDDLLPHAPFQLHTCIATGDMIIIYMGHCVYLYFAVAGVSTGKLVEAHGSFSTASCINCKTKQDPEQVKVHVYTYLPSIS